MPLQNLAGAQQVHTFDRDAQDTIDWIAEKEVAASSEDYGHDLQSVETLINKHDGLDVSASTNRRRHLGQWRAVAIAPEDWDDAVVRRTRF